MGELQVYLASSSPRRAQLLEQIGVRFEVIATKIDELPRPGETPLDMALRLAVEKAKAGLQFATLNIPVLAADTLVVCNDEIMGKPENMEHSEAMLTRLSGITHCVITAVAVGNHDRIETVWSETMVTFRKIEKQEIEAYCAMGEPADKAGSYAIQGLGAVFVSSIKGSYSGTVGLPLMETAALLARFGIHCLGDER
jgi:septum formation protein